MKPQLSASRRRGLVAALLSTGLSSVAILLQAQLAKQFDPLALAALSTAFGGLFLACISMREFSAQSLAKVRRVIRPLLCLILLRVLLGGIFFWSALSLTIGAKAIFFTKAEPYFVLFWSWLFDGHLIGRSHLFLLTVHFIGAILLSLGDRAVGYSQTQGDLLLICAVSVLALSYRFGAQVTQQIGSRLSSCLSQLSGSLVLIFICIVSSIEFAPCFEPKAFVQIILAAFLWNVLGIIFWFEALKVIEPWLVSSLRVLGPLIALPIAWIFMDERLNSVQLIGAALVLITSYSISYRK